MALFANTLQNPRGPNASSDLELMSSVTRIISKAVESMGDQKIRHVSKIFEKMTHVAVLFVKQALAEDVQNVKQLSQSSSGSRGQTPVFDESESPESVMATELSSAPSVCEPMVRDLFLILVADTHAAQSDAMQIPFSDLSPDTLWRPDPSMLTAMGPSYTNYQVSASNNNGITSQLPLTSPTSAFDYTSSTFTQFPEEDNFMTDEGGTSSFQMLFPWGVGMTELWMRDSEHRTQYP